MVTITTKVYAFRLGLTPARVRQLLKEQRIPGAVKIGRDWLIPEESLRESPQIRSRRVRPIQSS